MSRCKATFVCASATDDLLGRPLGGLGKGRNGGGVRCGHDAYFTAEPSIHEGFTAFQGNLKRRL
jgi:hypothetical protein